ncbi:unnamed protein product, partial [Prorocentrum cordatum]
PNDDQPWAEFYTNNLWVVGFLILTLLLFLVLSLFERRWKKRAKTDQHHSEVMQ